MSIAAKQYTFAEIVDIECPNPKIAELLKIKNKAYGNSALDPVRFHSKASASEQIRVRIDDKLSRLIRGKNTEAVPEDTVNDLLGYLVLLRIAERYTLVDEAHFVRTSQGTRAVDLTDAELRSIDLNLEEMFSGYRKTLFHHAVELPFKLLHQDAFVPTKAHDSDSGFDLYAMWSFQLLPRETKRVETGVAVQIPEGYEVQARPRSGNSSKGVLVHLGTVDQGYRGDLTIVMTNLSTEDVDFERGQKIGQFVLCPIPRVSLKQVEELDVTERGAKGFGSSGA